jgi:hypothetical protein
MQIPSHGSRSFSVQCSRHLTKNRLHLLLTMGVIFLEEEGAGPISSNAAFEIGIRFRFCAPTGSASGLFAGNQRQEKFLQSLTLFERQPAQVNPHPISADNADDRPRAHDWLHPLGQTQADVHG